MPKFLGLLVGIRRFPCAFCSMFSFLNVTGDVFPYSFFSASFLTIVLNIVPQQRRQVYTMPLNFVLLATQNYNSSGGSALLLHSVLPLLYASLPLC